MRRKQLATPASPFEVPPEALQAATMLRKVAGKRGLGLVDLYRGLGLLTDADMDLYSQVRFFRLLAFEDADAFAKSYRTRAWVRKFVGRYTPELVPAKAVA